MRRAWRVLAAAYGTELGHVERLYLAGGFARHIDVEAACRIGLIPDLPRDRIVKLGNAALLGASMALLSRRRRAAIERTCIGWSWCGSRRIPDSSTSSCRGASSCRSGPC